MSGPGWVDGVAATDGTATDRHSRGVPRMSAEMVNSSLVLIAGIVAVSMVFAAVDLLRQPTWAWRAAGEPKIVCLLMVLLLPGVGLAIYVFGARPKVVEIAANGRAASLPFERFGDRAESAVESSRAIQALARPMTRGSFGEPITRTIRESTPVGATPSSTTPTCFRSAPPPGSPRRAACPCRWPSRRSPTRHPSPPSGSRAGRAGPTTRGNAPRSTRGRSAGRRWPPWPPTSPSAGGAAEEGRPPRSRSPSRSVPASVPWPGASRPCPHRGSGPRHPRSSAPGPRPSPPSPTPRPWPPRRWPPWPPAG